MKIFAPEKVLDVYRALALENMFLDYMSLIPPLLFCWVGEAAVVMGKNQNPWRECNLEMIRRRNLKLARRVSGGGSVYHDPGNLNIAWILPREGYRADRMHEVLIRALKRSGIQAASGQGGSLRVPEGKISGSAYCFRRDRVLHHCTLLLDADLELLRAVLSPPRLQMETHAVDSVPASVVNLKTLVPGLTQEMIQESLIQEAEPVFGRAVRMERGPFPDPMMELESLRMGSSEWIWDQTPGFRSALKLSDGKEFRFRIHKGKMSECQMDNEPVELEESPNFPDGDFRELETKLGREAGSLARSLMDAGWVKI